MQAEYVHQALTHAAVLLKPGASWTRESIDNVVAEITPFNEAAMTAAVKRMSVEFSPGILPPLRKVTDLIIQEGQKYNMAHGTPEPLRRHENDRQFQSTFGDKANEYTKRAAALCVKTACGLMTIHEQITACEWMEKTYPGVGWKDQMLWLIRKQRGELDNA